MTGAVVEASALCRSFDGRPAVRDLDLAVAAGEVLGLLGVQGAGKTTALRMLGALLLPTSGRAAVCGHDVVTETDAVRRSVGCVLRPVPDIAGVLRHRPRVLLLDEPTLGLGTEPRHRVWDQVRRLRDDGVTVLLGTSCLDEAGRLCDRVVVVDRGSAVAVGRPADVLGRTGGDLLRLTTTAARTAVAVLRAQPWTHEVRADPAAPGEVLLHVVDATDALAGVFAALDAAGVGVERMTYTRPSLRDVVRTAAEGRAQPPTSWRSRT